MKKILVLFAIVILSIVISVNFTNDAFAAEYTNNQPDTDGDGIPDSSDSCPTDPETVNGFQDSDGCPDVVPSTSSNSITVEIAKGSGSNTSCADKCYTPNTVQIKTGGTVTWNNVDTAVHTVTSGKDATSDGIFDSGMIMAGNSFNHTFYNVGTFDYFCMVHPWMKGIILVGEGTYIPLIDTDNDGIPDSLDSCPTQPETVNGFKDSDGCPDVIPSNAILIKFPSYFKNTARSWAEGQITDYEFLQRVQIEINRGTMIIPDVNTGGTGNSGASIPSWIKNNAKWWSDGKIDDSSFVQGIQYLFKDGILPVKITSTDVDSQPESITVRTSRSSYDQGDRVIVLGNVPPVNLSVDVKIIVRAPDNNIVRIAQAHPNADGSFQTSFDADGPQFKTAGDYTILADFSGLKSQITFEFTGGNGDIVSGGDSQPTTCPSGQNLINGKCVAKPTSEPEPKTVSVTIPTGTSSPGCETSNACYSPASLTISAGDTVEWTNTDTAAHTVTGGTPSEGPSGTFDSSLVLAGSSFEWTPTAEGEYPYFCMVHPWMVGIILVGEGTYIPPQPEGNFDLQVIMGNQVYDLSDTATMNLSINGISTSQNVALEISDPRGTSIISRSFMVDSNGIGFEFKIDENFKTGTYKVIATTSNNGNTITDTTYFKVKSQYNSFKITSVQVTDQQGNPSNLQKGEIGFIKVNLEASKSITTLVTVNLFDSDLTSIGIGSIKTTLSSGNSEIILSFMIPSDVAVGSSNIYVNAFSDWLSNGGIPLTGEISVTENIE